MITHDDFIAQYANTFLERVDGTNKNQCFDLAVAYCEDVLGMPRAIFAGLLNASQIFTMPTINTASRFDFIENNSWAVPRKGDIIVWGKSYGPAGHVAIVHEANVNSLTAFSQNDPIGKPCHLKTYTYMNILGWLRLIKPNTNNVELEKKIENLTNSERILKQQLQDKDKQIKETSDNAARELEKQAKTAQLMIDQTKKEYKDKINELTNQILFLVEEYKQQ